MKQISNTLALLTAVLLVGCQSPQYKVIYDYQKPSGKQGEVCINRCKAALERCKVWAQKEQMQCESQNRVQQVNTSVEVSATPSPIVRHHGGKEPSICQSIGGPLAICERDFNACYELCGGKVTSRQVCVENCSQEAS